MTWTWTYTTFMRTYPSEAKEYFHNLHFFGNPDLLPPLQRRAATSGLSGRAAQRCFSCSNEGGGECMSVALL